MSLLLVTSDDKTERTQLVLLVFAAALDDFAAMAVVHVTSKGVAGNTTVAQA